VPPMAANFFQGTLGQFASYGQVSGGGVATANQQSRYENATGQSGGQQRTNQGTARNASNEGMDQAPQVVNTRVSGIQQQTVAGDRVTPGTRGAAERTSTTTTAVPPSSASPSMLSGNQRGQNNDPGTIS